MIGYLKLWILSCLFGVLLCFVLMGLGAAYIWFTKGFLFLPIYQMKRALVFGVVGGTAMASFALLSDTIDYFNARKKEKDSNHE